MTRERQEAKERAARTIRLLIQELLAAQEAEEKTPAQRKYEEIREREQPERDVPDADGDY